MFSVSRLLAIRGRQSFASQAIRQSPSVYNQMFLSRYFGAVNVNLPDLGEGTKEATVKQVYVKVGDRVEEYDDLLEVFTDKLVAKIPSTATGIVTAVNYGDDEVARVGHPLIVIEEEGGEDAVQEEVPAALPLSAETIPKVQTEKVVKDKVQTAPPGNNAPKNAGAKALSTPAVRYLAKKEGININDVPGTGKNGRVTKTDILNFMNSGSAAATPAAKAGPTVISGVPRIAPLYGITEKDQVKKITGMKKAMTKTMTESLSIPFLTYSDEMDATQLIALRKQLKASNPKLSMLPFFIKACSLAMTEFPIVNSHIDNDLDEDGYIQRYVIKHDHNYSIAIDSADGLTVPAIKKVQEKSVLAINNELIELRNKVESGGLTKADFEDATFSVSSVGNLGGRYFVPTILRPQAAIIAIGQAHKSARYVEDASHEDGYKWVPQDSINFSISADHRVLDGATVARFSSKMKTLIENPNLMLLNMA